MKDDVTTRVAHMLFSPLVLIVCKLRMTQGVGRVDCRCCVRCCYYDLPSSGV